MACSIGQIGIAEANRPFLAAVRVIVDKIYNKGNFTWPSLKKSWKALHELLHVSNSSKKAQIFVDKILGCCWHFLSYLELEPSKLSLEPQKTVITTKVTQCLPLFSNSCPHAKHINSAVSLTGTDSVLLPKPHYRHRKSKLQVKVLQFCPGRIVKLSITKFLTLTLRQENNAFIAWRFSFDAME